jgi:glucose uptake protein
MILPSSYEMALLLGLLALLCGGIWVSTYKMGGNWRFELYYFDFAFGTVVASLVAGLTFGSMGTDLSFWDNISLTAGRRVIATNLLILAGASIGGIAMAFPSSFAVALLVESLWALVDQRTFNFVFLGIGWALLLLVVLLCGAAAKRIRVVERVEPEMVTTAEAVPSAQVGGPKYYRRRREEKKDLENEAASWKSILFAAAGGLLLGFVPGIGAMAQVADIGLGAYGFAFVFTMGIFVSTFVFNLYFMNLPVQGPAVQFFRYFQGGLTVHLLGLLGGILFAVGTLAALLMVSAPANETPGALAQYLLTRGAPLLVVGLGLLGWKELASSPAARGLIAVAAVVYLAAVALLGSAGRS